MSRNSRKLKIGLYPRDPVLAIGEISNAIDDLNFSRVAYSNEYHAKSLQNLQESIEKAGKSYGYFVGAINQKDAQYLVGHQLTKLYFLSTEYYDELIKSSKKRFDFLDFSELFSDLKNFNSSFSALFNEINLQKILDSEEDITEENFLNISDKALTSYIDYTNRELIIFFKIMDLLEIPESNQKMILMFKRTGRKKMRSVIKSSFKLGVKFPPRSFYYFKKASDPEIVRYLEFVTISQYSLKILFLLACITQYHQSYTRYCDQKGITPQAIYSQEHPLVKKFLQIATIEEVLTTILKQFYIEFKDFDLKF
jgi:hypothetical protein